MANDGLITIGIVPDDSQWTRTLRNLANNSSRMISQSINAHVQPLGRITGEASEFQKSLAASNARVIAFGASTGAIFAMRAAFRHLIQSTIEVEKHLASINSLFMLGSKDLQQFSGRLFQIANDMSVPFKDAAKAAEEFAQLGLTAEETLKRTGAALALSRTSGMDFRAAVQSLNATMNSFAKESLNATEVVDKLSNVSAKFAVTSDDLAEGLKRVGASANDANITLDQTISLITAAQQVTARGGAVIGNAFKSIFTRMIRPEVLDDLEAVGVTVRNTEGRLLPLIQTLKNLSATYDRLPQAQRAFVAETVGGIYQINILKAVLRDLGTGASIYESAMDAAATATDMTNKRMEVLNSTISSQLIRTMNTLTQTASNIGKITFGQGMRSGIGSFEGVAKNIGAFSDPTTKHDNVLEKGLANLWQGALRGLGNFIKGPAIQFAAFALLKLFQRLETFIVQSAKELVGVNRAEKERQAINKGIAEWLGKQEGMLERILKGQMTINQAAQQYVESMKDAVASAASLAGISGNMGAIAIKQVQFATPQAARGYIPNLEIQQAMRGGYQAGHVLNTTLRNGFQTIDVTANSAESRTRIMRGGQAYDFVNPPRFSGAGRRHEEDSIRLTGLNPYELPGSPIKASGFVPNLALSPELVATIHQLGIRPEDYLRHKGAKPTDLTDLPENVVSAFVHRYSDDTRSLAAALRSLTRKGALAIPNTAEGLYKFFAGFMVNAEARNQGIFGDMRDKKSIQAFAETIVGKRAMFATSTMQAKASQVRLRPSDVQKALDLHSETIPFIAAYESPHDLRPAQDRPNFSDFLNFQEEGGQMFKFKIKMPIFGHKTAFGEHFDAIRELLRQRTKRAKPMAMSVFGGIFGKFFDDLMKGEAEAEGIQTGEDEDSPLDIYEPVKSIIAQTNIGKRPVSALELKASAAGATESGRMAQKIFRTLAGEPGAGKGRKAALKGPVGYVPKLAKSAAFDASVGGIGILDADFMRERGISQETFESMVYAVAASGKPMRIHYGPMTTGKTTAAAHIVQHSGGLGGRGGDYITSFDQIDSDAFKQFIINKTDAKNLNTGVFGFALSSASQVRGFFSPFASYSERQEEMIRRLVERNRGQEARHAKALTLSPEEWQEYANNMEHLQKKLGDRFAMYDPQNPFASSGFIPNLGWPKFPDFTEGKIGGQLVRKSSIGVSDNYFDRKIQTHIQRIIRLAKSLNPDSFRIRMTRTYGGEYGNKLATLFLGLEGNYDLAHTSSGIWNNLKGWMGERFIQRRLSESGVLRNVTKLPEQLKLDMGAELSATGETAGIETKFMGKIGRYKELKRKFRQSPFDVHYLIGNDDTHTAMGFVPNLAKQLGHGYYGRFIDLERVYRGAHVGKKVFKATASDKDVEQEYLMGKALEASQKAVSPLFAFPRVFGSLARAKQRRTVGKEVVKGSTIIPEDLWEKNVRKADEIYDEDTQIGRVWSLAQEFQAMVSSELATTGIATEDFIGHPGNTLFNHEARKLLMKLSADPSKWGMLMGKLKGNLPAQQQVASAMARQGARMFAVDPGMFEQIGTPPKPLPWQRQTKTLASGFVPNLAGPLYHNQLGIPDNIRQQISKLAARGISVFPTQHARSAMLDDIRRYGIRVTSIPRTLSFDPSQIVEVECDPSGKLFPGTEISKIVVRRPGQSGLDQVLAIGGDGGIRTVWHNESTDQHRTLDASKYQTDWMKKAARGFIPNLAFDPARLSAAIEGTEFSQWDLSSILGDLVWNVAHNQGPTRQQELQERFNTYSRNYHSSVRNHGPDSDLARMYRDWMIETRRELGARGLIQASHPSNTHTADRLAQFPRDRQRAIRRMAIEIGKEYAPIAETGGNAFRHVDTILTEHFDRVRATRYAEEQRLAEERWRRESATQSTTQGTLEGATRESLVVPNNSSRLSLTGQSLYVDFLKRKAYYNMDTARIEEEANPLITILKQIKKGAITSVSATVIGPKIPAIFQKLIEYGEAGKLPKGFQVHAHWSPKNLFTYAEQAMNLLPQAQAEREDDLRHARKPYGRREITGFMRQKDHDEMLAAFRFFGHDENAEHFNLDRTFAWGHIPNLFDPIADALGRENRATGGHARLTSHPLLKSAYNPLGLVAIDKRNQSNATEAITQHLMGGQTIGEVRRAHTARGFVPNLAGFGMVDPANTGGIFSSTGTVNSLLLGVLADIRNRRAERTPTQESDERLLNRRFGKLFATEAERLAAELRMLDRAFRDLITRMQHGETITAPEWGERPRRRIRPTTTNAADAYLLNVPAPEPIARGRRRDYTPQQTKELEEMYERSIASRKARLAQLQARDEERSGKYRSGGMGLAIASSLGGGVATQFAELASPSFGAAVNEFNNGLTQAGQVLLTFPTKFGAFAAMSTGVNAFASAIDVWSKGLHTSRMMFEAQTSKFEKTNSLLDALTASISSYDSMIADSKVTFEAIQREQRRYAETIAQLTETGGSTKFLGRLSGASTSQERMSIILEEKGRLSREQEGRAGIQSLMEYAGARTFLYGGSRMMGVNPFGYSTEGQKVALEQTLRSNATAQIANMSEALKELLSSSSDAADFLRRLGEAANSSDKNISDYASTLKKGLDELGRTSLAGRGGLTVPVGQIIAQLKTEKLLNTPEAQAKMRQVRERTAERLEFSESLLNRAKFQQKLFINTGAAQAGVTYNLRALAGREATAAALVYGSMRQVRPGVPAPESVLQREAGMGLMRMQYGERTMAAYEGQTEVKRINAEYKATIGKMQIEASKAVSGTLRQGFEDKVRIAELMRSAGKPEGGLPALGDVTDLNSFGIKLTESVNRGIAAVAKSGNITRFRNANTGAIDLERFAAEVAQKGAQGGPMSKSVFDFVRSQVGQEALETMLNYNNQLGETNSDYLQRIATASIKTAAVLEESNFKEMSNYMGGIKNLLDRGGRRSMERNLTRGAVLMTRGRTTEARAYGASLFLRTLQEQNIPIDISGKTPLSRMIIAARETAVQNLADVQRRSIGRATGAVGRLTGQSIATAGMFELFGRAGTERARAAVTAAFPIEDEKRMMAGLRDISTTTSFFEAELYSSIKALQGFSSSLTTTKQDLFRAVNASTAGRKWAEEENQKDFIANLGDVVALVDKLRAEGPLAGTQKDSLGKKLALNVGGLTPGVLLMGAALLGTAAPGSLLGRATTYAAGGLGRGYSAVRGLLPGGRTPPPPGPPSAITPAQTRSRNMMASDQAFLTRMAQVESQGGVISVAEQKRLDRIIKQRGGTSIPQEWTGKRFSYRYMTPAGKTLSGTLTATSEAEVLASIKQLGYFPLNVTEARPTTPTRFTASAAAMQKAGRPISVSTIPTSWQRGPAATAQVTPVAPPAPIPVTPPAPTGPGPKRGFGPTLVGPQTPIVKAKGRGKAALLPLLIAGTTALIYSSRSAQAGETPTYSPEQEMEPRWKATPSESLGQNAFNYSLMMRSAGASRFASGLKGGAAGLLGYGAEYAGEKAFGQWGGFTAATATTAGVMGYTMRGGIPVQAYGVAGRTLGSTTLGLKPWQYGALRGGLGMGVALASDYARGKVADRYGYHAGLQVGGIGNVLGGAMMLGPVGAAIGAAAYVGGEAYNINQEQKAGIAYGHALEGERMGRQSQRLTGKLSQGVSREELAKEAERLASQLFNRGNELESKKSLDVVDTSKGFFDTMWGKMGSWISRSAFTQKDQRQLNLVREQQQNLGQALMSGSDERLVDTLQELADQIGRQNEELTRPETKGGVPTGTIPPINSNLKVEISVKDFDRIPSEINDTIVSPLAQQLAGLEMRVNELVNQITPRPARIRQ